MSRAAEPSPPFGDLLGNLLARLQKWGTDGALDVATAAGRIVLVLLLAFALRALVHRAVDRVVARAIARPVGHESMRQRLLDMSPAVANERRQQRAETIGSVLRSTASIVILGVAFATVLSELDFDLGPVLASAGILGVALGFGAQNLVKDFLNGIFMILEDQYGVGDAVDLGEASGIVEAVGLRVTRVRNVDGTVWYVRNGEVVRVGNMSQGWSRALLDVSVAYGTDVDFAEDVIERVAREVWEGDKVGEFVLAEPEIWGVERLGADGIDIRLVVKTAPLEQWKVARELRHRLKEAFDAEGIEIPFPQRSLWLRTAPGAAPQPVTDPDAADAPAPAPAATPASTSPRRTAPPPSGEVDAMREDTGVLQRPGS